MLVYTINENVGFAPLFPIFKKTTSEKIWFICIESKFQLTIRFIFYFIYLYAYLYYYNNDKYVFIFGLGFFIISILRAFSQNKRFFVVKPKKELFKIAPFSVIIEWLLYFGSIIIFLNGSSSQASPGVAFAAQVAQIIIFPFLFLPFINIIYFKCFNKYI